MRDLEKNWRKKFDDLALLSLSDWQRACWWDRNTLYYHQRFALDAIKKFSNGKSLKIGDIGCGSGIYCLTLSKLDHQIVGLDFAQKTLHLARQRERGEMLKLCAGDANALPFKENAFDAVLSIGLMQTANDPWRLLEQMDAVLRPGGLLLVSTLSQQSIWELPWWPFYCLLYCDGFPPANVFSQRLVKERYIMPPRPIDEPELVLKRFKVKDITEHLNDMGYHNISAEYNTRFAKIPLLYNSFMVNIKAIKPS